MTRKLSKIDLFQETGFDDTYKHVVDWKNHEELNAYLDEGHAKVSLIGSYQNIARPVRWNSKEISFNDLTKYTYIRITNEDPNGATQQFYGFITNLEYVNDGCTFIYYSIDQWNTYKWNIDLNSAMIERGFCKEYNDDYSDWTDEFRTIKNNLEEIGGDGAEHLVASENVYFTPMDGQKGKYYDNGFIKFVVFTAQPKDVQKDHGSRLGVYSQYKYYILAYDVHSGTVLNFLDKDGKTLLDMKKQDISDVYNAISSDADLAGSSSLVVDSELLDYVGLDFTVVMDGNNSSAIKFKQSFKTRDRKNFLEVYDASDSKFDTQEGVLFNDSTNIPQYKNMFDYLQQLLNFRLASQLQVKNVPFKLVAKPFTKLTFTDGRGSMMNVDFLKFNRLNMEKITLQRFGGLTENSKIGYVLNNYNRAKTKDSTNLATYENAMLIDDSAHDTPLILDNYTMYLNSNRNQLANTRANAKMNLQLSKEGNLISLQNLGRSQSASRQILGLEQANERNNFKFNTMANLGMQTANTGVGLLMNPTGAGLVGGAMGMLGAGVSAYAQNRSMKNNQATARAAQSVSQNAESTNARVNYAFANKVATNNYEQTLRSQNAMLADVRNHNDVLAHQGTNQAWDMQNKNNSLHGQIYFSQDAVMLNAGLYFLLFGYAINLYSKVDAYRYRKSVFNYVRTSNAQVTGIVSQTVINTFNSMLDSGVTFWNSSKLTDFLNRDYRNNQFN